MKNYFKIAAYFVFVAVVMGISASTILVLSESKVFALSGGPANGRTGSPADGLKTCHDTVCHNSFTPNSGKAKFSISVPGSYTLGEVLNITISFSDSNTARHGFELSALDADNEHVGTFSSVDNKTQTTDGKGHYIKHTLTGDNQSGNASFNVTWTAPSSEVENPVTFYAAGNEANGDFTPKNDYIYTTTEQISNVATTPTATPTPSGCEPESVSTDTEQLNLILGESKTVIVTVTGSNDCSTEEATVNAKINKTGKKRVTVTPANDQTDANGQATFTITAGQKKGIAKVAFTVEESDGEIHKASVKVKIKKE